MKFQFNALKGEKHQKAQKCTTSDWSIDVNEKRNNTIYYTFYLEKIQVTSNLLNGLGGLLWHLYIASGYIKILKNFDNWCQVSVW